MLQPELEKVALCKGRCFRYTLITFSSSLLVCSVYHCGLLMSLLVFPKSYSQSRLVSPSSLAMLLTIWDHPSSCLGFTSCLPLLSSANLHTEY